MRSKKVLIVREITMGLLQDLLIILSFGLTTPLLGLAVIASLVSKTLRWHHLICAFVVFDKQGQRRDLENLTGNCGEHSDNAHALFPARWFLVGYSVCFLAFSLIDTAGDAVGIAASVWAPLLMLLLPPTLGLLLERCFLFRSDVTPSSVFSALAIAPPRPPLQQTQCVQ